MALMSNIQRNDLWSPLHLASANGHLKIAELLVQRGAMSTFSITSKKPHLIEQQNGKVAIARLLIDHGANVHSADSNGWTPLHAASHGGHLGIVKLLLRRGADVDVLNKANKTAAELASENGKARLRS
jgi:ankyrin repeat protein